MKKLLITISILGLIGVYLSGHLTYLHFAPDAAEFCSFSAEWDCDKVNKSKWSYIDVVFMEIPVSILGLLTYLVFFIVPLLVVKGVDFTRMPKAVGLRRLNNFFTQKGVMTMLLLLAGAGVLFSLYLTYIEAFILKTFCLYCVLQQVVIVLIVVLLIFAYRKVGKKGDK